MISLSLPHNTPLMNSVNAKADVMAPAYVAISASLDAISNDETMAYMYGKTDTKEIASPSLSRAAQVRAQHKSTLLLHTKYNHLPRRKWRVNDRLSRTFILCTLDILHVRLRDTNETTHMGNNEVDSKERVLAPAISSHIEDGHTVFSNFFNSPKNCLS